MLGACRTTRQMLSFIASVPVSNAFPTSDLRANLLIKRTEGDFDTGAIVGTIVGLVCAAAVFILVARAFFKYRSKKRRDHHIAMVDNNPAVMNVKMQKYSSQQQRRLRQSNASRKGSIASAYADTRGRAFKPVYTDSSNGYSPSPGPPPSYNATLSRPQPAVVR